ncbi:hypothetical protein [Thalassospira sp.]|uniref:hypothetical protein n=1 Tax=Thalassospira sp. TaxID=1912094 RepID=UPI0032EDE34A
MTVGGAISKDNSMLAIHTNFAIWSARRLGFLYPDLRLTLYGSEYTFTIYIENCPNEEFSSLSELFNDKIRPITCNITLANSRKNFGSIIDRKVSYESELWLNDEPLNSSELNKLIFLAESKLPEGGVDFDHEAHRWVFKSPTPLSETEKTTVDKAVNKTGITQKIDFIVVPPSMRHGHSSRTHDSLDLITSRELTRGPDTLKNLVERDEDEWRVFFAS